MATGTGFAQPRINVRREHPNDGRTLPIDDVPEDSKNQPADNRAVRSPSHGRRSRARAALKRKRERGEAVDGG
jgi:hypothetical protein